jgi:hypothetical protein
MGQRRRRIWWSCMFSRGGRSSSRVDAWMTRLVEELGGDFQILDVEDPVEGALSFAYRVGYADRRGGVAPLAGSGYSFAGRSSAD